MAFTFKGTVWIPMIEVWEFVAKNAEIPDSEMGQLSLKYEEESGLVISSKNGNVYYIDGVDFWVWVHAYFPNDTAETRCHIEKFGKTDLEIEVVMGSESPEGWVDSFKPEWLKK